MRNPWPDLPSEAPYVLEADRAHVEAFNHNVSEKHRLRLDMIPIPFMGEHDAPLVLLSLNPSFQPDSEVVEAGAGARSQALMSNLRSPGGNRHVGLSDEFADTGGSRWWRKCFRAVEKEGHVYDSLSRQVLTLEFHGYRSQNWQTIPFTLPSQNFGFFLLRNALERGATVVVMRGYRQWHVAVPELSAHGDIVRLHNARSATISRRNCGEAGFERVLQALGG